jgi:hypothetical protein
MHRKSTNEVNAFLLFIGLMLGFLLGSSVVYWHSNRQTDRLIEEVMEKVTALFTSGNQTTEKAVNTSNTPTPERPGERRTVAVKPAPEVIPAVENNDLLLIAHDRLLFTKIVSITNPEPVSANDRRLDSLLGNTSMPPQQQLMFIEFWESPLNYVGYKMGKNKIVIYGISQWELVSLASYNGNLYIRYLDEFFPVELTTNFKPLIPVNASFHQEHHF